MKEKKETLKDVVENYASENDIDHKELNIDTFGEVIDGFLKKADVKMLIQMPEGTDKIEINDNIGAGAVMWHYILMKALTYTLNALCRQMLDRDKMPDYLDAILDLVKRDVLDGLEEGS